jgi:hypothetical protein
MKKLFNTLCGAAFVLLCLNALPAKAQVWCTGLYATSDYCLTGNNGIYLCISTVIPEGMGCSSVCSTATCHHIHLRNVTNDNNDQIDRIKIVITKDANSSEYRICKPLKQYGISPWTSEWTILEDFVTSRATETCYNWNGALVHILEFIMPAGGGTDYKIYDLNHWGVTICGASAYTVYVRRASTGQYCTGGWTPTISSTACPPSCP